METKTKFVMHDYHPKQWFLWFVVFICSCMAKLPYDTLLLVGKKIGYFLFYKFNLASRRTVCQNNLRLVYPKLTHAEINSITKKHFESVGIGIAEAIFSWWGKFDKIKDRYEMQGCNHLYTAHNLGKGVILWWAHFTTMEISGRIIASKYPLVTVYKKNKKPTIDRLENYQRDKYRKGKIASNNIKLMLRALQENNFIWYSSDQSFTEKGYIDVPLFDTMAPSNNATSRISKLSGAPVVPFSCERKYKQGKFYYIIKFLPTIKNFPTHNAYNDIRQLHKIIEEQMENSFVDYFWLHRRWRKPPTT